MSGTMLEKQNNNKKNIINYIKWSKINKIKYGSQMTLHYILCYFILSCDSLLCCDKLVWLWCATESSFFMIMMRQVWTSLCNQLKTFTYGGLIIRQTWTCVDQPTETRSPYSLYVIWSQHMPSTQLAPELHTSQAYSKSSRLWELNSSNLSKLKTYSL